MTKALSSLISSIAPLEVHGSLDVQVERVTCDSRSVHSGDLFVAIRGTSADGHVHVADAGASGAVGAVVEEYVGEVPAMTQVVVGDTRSSLGPLAAELYDRPSSAMRMVGVAGTNGKTTTTYLLSSIFEAAGIAAGHIGTVSVRWPGGEIQSKLTTPDAATLQELLARIRDDGTQAVSMEVSSHAIEMGRHLGCSFDALVFTNLSQDHLDFHKDMDSYFNAKRELFVDARVHKESALACINLDDRWGRRLARETTLQVLGYAVEPEDGGMQAAHAVDAAGSNTMTPWCVARDIQVSSDGTRFRLTTASGVDAAVEMPLLGRLNVYNAVAAACGALALGIDAQAIVNGLAAAEPPPGRLEAVPNSANITVLVDYAHTPDGLRATLAGCRELTEGRLICVFGCGGDRDSTKRPLMGAEVARAADIAIVTSDNPRSEPPMTIIEAILTGMSETEPIVEVDRRSAIRIAFETAAPGDLVLIAGKGHETGQIVGSQVLPFSDIEVARELLGELAGRSMSRESPASPGGDV